MKRDLNILKAYKREISLHTRINPSKKHYTRKYKHKNTQLTQW